MHGVSRHSGVSGDTGDVRQDVSAVEKRSRRTRMLGWWYVCIGVAFTLLAVRSILRGDPLWSIVIRFLISVGFFALAAGTLRSVRADRRQWRSGG
jgi:hypothetical protein